MLVSNRLLASEFQTSRFLDFFYVTRHLRFSGEIRLLMCYRHICRVVLSVSVVICILCALWRWWVRFYTLLLVASYVFYFGGDPSLVEVRRDEFSGDVLCK